MYAEIIDVIEKEIGNKIVFWKKIAEGHSKDEKYCIESTTKKYFIRLLPFSLSMKEKYQTLKENLREHCCHLGEPKTF